MTCRAILEAPRYISKFLEEDKYVPLATEYKGLSLAVKGLLCVTYHGPGWVKDIWRKEETLLHNGPLPLSNGTMTVLGGAGVVAGIVMMASLPKEVFKGAWNMSKWTVSVLCGSLHSTSPQQAIPPLVVQPTAAFPQQPVAVQHVAAPQHLPPKSS